MGCQIGRIIIVNNSGIIIFGDVAELMLNQTSGETGSTDNAEPAQNGGNISASSSVSAKRSKRNRHKSR